MSITREQALSFIQTKCDFALQRHLFFVATAMETLAIHLGHADEKDRWFLAGILHDIDWNSTIDHPEDHCGEETMQMLETMGVDKEIREVIKAHYREKYPDIILDTDFKKALFCIDELSGFIVACAQVRPTKMIGITSSSILKKMKTANFAAQVSREDMKSCEALLNIPIQTMIDLLIPSFETIAPNWELV